MPSIINFTFTRQTFSAIDEIEQVVSKLQMELAINSRYICPMKFSVFSLKERPYGDFHTHTNVGSDDGKVAPSELLNIAEERKLAFLSISGHNSVAGLREAQKSENRKLFNGGILPATEIGVLADGVPIEILAYAFDIDKMEKELGKLPVNAVPDAYGRYVTNAVNELMASKGLKIDHDCGCDCTRWLDGLHAKILEKYPGYLAKFDSRFEDNYKYFLREGLLNPDSPFSVDLRGIYPTMEQVSEMVNDCGGVKVYAHPEESYERKHKAMRYLTDNKLIDGIECMHPSAKPHKQKKYINLCKKNDFIITGGSDFHSSPKYQVGSQHVPAELIKQFNPQKLV